MFRLFTIPVAYAASKTSSAGIGDDLTGIQELLQTVLHRAPYWIVGLIVVIVAFILAKISQKMVADKVVARLDEEHQDVVALSGRTAFITVLVLGLTIGMKIAGMDLTPIIAALGLGMGFAMQGIITNFVAGVIVVLSRHFTIGDYIQVDDLVGKIVEIQTRATILQALDGTKVIVPNADLFNGKVTSFTSNPFRRIEVVQSVGYDVDLTKACQVCMATMLTLPGILKDPKPQVLITEFDNSWINLTLRFWVESRSNWLSVKSEITRLGKENLEKVGMYVPYPIVQNYRYQGEDTRKEQERLLKENFNEFEKILKEHKVGINNVSSVKPNGEEKPGSEFLANNG